MNMKHSEVLKMYLDTYKSESSIKTETRSIGDGEWVIYVYGMIPDDGKVLLFGITGSNGTHTPPDDLWGKLDKLLVESGYYEYFPIMEHTE